MQPDTMQSEWQNFLSRVGAKLAGGEVHDFGDVEREHAASLETAALIDLSRDSFVRAAGPHALTFLNGQLSKDLRQLDERHHMLAAYCNPQGRVIALPRLWRQGDELVLQLPAALVEPVLERLRRFILRAKVTLNPDPGLAAIGLIGPQCGEGLASVLTTDVPPSGTLHRAGATTLLGLPGIVPRLEIVLPAGQRAELWQQLAAHATPAGMLIWRWHDIRAGLPTVLPETSAAFVPQMLNLDVLNGISFDKGCYPGQEIVARMHYLGRLKQRLYGLSLADRAVPAPGSEIFASNFGDQSAGTVLDAVSLTPGRSELLGVVQVAAAETGQLHLASLSGPPLTIASLPYSVPAPRAQ